MPGEIKYIDLKLEAIQKMLVIHNEEKILEKIWNSVDKWNCITLWEAYFMLDEFENQLQYKKDGTLCRSAGNTVICTYIYSLIKDIIFAETYLEAINGVIN